MSIEAHALDLRRQLDAADRLIQHLYQENEDLRRRMGLPVPYIESHLRGMYSGFEGTFVVDWQINASHKVALSPDLAAMLKDPRLAEVAKRETFKGFMARVRPSFNEFWRQIEGLRS